MNLKKNYFSSKPTQITQAAVNISRRVFGDLKDVSIITINDTEIAQTIFDNFKQIKIKKINQISEVGVKSFRDLKSNDFNKIIEEIKDYDILIFGFSGDDRIIDEKIISNILKQRKQKPIIIIDCGIPGNVDTNARRITNCFLFDLNDLEQIYSQDIKYGLKGQNAAQGTNNVEILLHDFYNYLDFNSSQKGLFENKIRKFLDSNDLKMYDTIKAFLKIFK